VDQQHDPGDLKITPDEGKTGTNDYDYDADDNEHGITYLF
jgi:hypothetical protein